MKEPQKPNYKLPSTLSTLKNGEKMQIYKSYKVNSIKSPYFSVNTIMSKSSKNGSNNDRMSIQTALKQVESQRNLSNLFSGYL